MAPEGQNDAELKRAVGNAVRLARASKGLSQSKLASEIRSDIKTVGRIERGEFLPSLGTLLKIADLTGWSLDAIVGRAAATPLIDPLERERAEVVHGLADTAALAEATDADLGALIAALVERGIDLPARLRERGSQQKDQGEGK